MLLLENSLLSKFRILVGADVFFLLRSMEEGKGEDGDGCCALDV